MIINKYFTCLNVDAGNKNRDNIKKLLEYNNNAIFLDLGCGDGIFTASLADIIGTKNIFGIEAFEENIPKCESKNISVKSCNLNGEFPFESNFFDAVHSNQVIEHLYDLDNFINQIHRTLKPGGYAIISTENLSSWHNIFALSLGYQPFTTSSLSNIKMSVGNPFGLAKKLKPIPFQQHIRGLSYEGFIEMFKIHNLQVEKVLASGYYPSPNFLARVVSKLDKRHAAYLAIKVRKLK